MGIQDTRKIIKTGNSVAVTIPAALKIGEVATLAGNRLLLIDPRGEIPKEDLLEFMEKILEPNLWSFLKEKENSSTKMK